MLIQHRQEPITLTIYLSITVCGCNRHGDYVTWLSPNFMKNSPLLLSYAVTNSVALAMFSFLERRHQLTLVPKLYYLTASEAHLRTDRHLLDRIFKPLPPPPPSNEGWQGNTRSQTATHVPIHKLWQAQCSTLSLQKLIRGSLPSSHDILPLLCNSTFIRVFTRASHSTKLFIFDDTEHN
jgi:hypothetical protein